MKKNGKGNAGPYSDCVKRGMEKAMGGGKMKKMMKGKKMMDKKEK